jgi:hypothetical protein
MIKAYKISLFFSPNTPSFIKRERCWDFFHIILWNKYEYQIFDYIIAYNNYDNKRRKEFYIQFK